MVGIVLNTFSKSISEIKIFVGILLKLVFHSIKTNKAVEPQYRKIKPSKALQNSQFSISDYSDSIHRSIHCFFPEIEFDVC